MKENHKCNRDICVCEVADDQEFCSEICEESDDQDLTEIKCDCGHNCC